MFCQVPLITVSAMPNDHIFDFTAESRLEIMMNARVADDVRWLWFSLLIGHRNKNIDKS